MKECFWKKCSDSKRCASFGSCVAKAQAGGATFPSKEHVDLALFCAGVAGHGNQYVLALEVERLQRKLDTCGLECSATLKSLVAEIERLRTCLTGISTCSACEACRGAATLALGEVTCRAK